MLRPAIVKLGETCQTFFHRAGELNILYRVCRPETSCQYHDVEVDACFFEIIISFENNFANFEFFSWTKNVKKKLIKFEELPPTASFLSTTLVSSFKWSLKALLICFLFLLAWVALWYFGEMDDLWGMIEFDLKWRNLGNNVKKRNLKRLLWGLNLSSE